MFTHCLGVLSLMTPSSIPI